MRQRQPTNTLAEAASSSEINKLHQMQQTGAPARKSWDALGKGCAGAIQRVTHEILGEEGSMKDSACTVFHAWDMIELAML